MRRARPPHPEEGHFDICTHVLIGEMSRHSNYSHLRVESFCRKGHVSNQMQAGFTVGLLTRTEGHLDIWTPVLFGKMARHFNCSNFSVESFCPQGHVSKCPSGCGGLFKCPSGCGGLRRQGSSRPPHTEGHLGQLDTCPFLCKIVPQLNYSHFGVGSFCQ